MRTSAAIAAFIATALICVCAAADGPKVSRLPGAPGQPPDLPSGRQGAEARDIINLSITRGHAPKIARATGIVAGALRNDAVAPRILRELAIMRTALFFEAHYEINQHIPMIKACGYDEAKIAAVKDWRRSPLFDDRERALLAFVDQMTGDGDVDDPTFDRMASLYSSQEIVEFAATVSYYAATALFTKALRVETETDGRQASMGKC